MGRIQRSLAVLEAGKEAFISWKDEGFSGGFQALYFLLLLQELFFEGKEGKQNRAFIGDHHILFQADRLL